MNQMSQSSPPIPVLAGDQEPAGDDPFNLNKLQLSQDLPANLEVKKDLLTVPVRKPNPQCPRRLVAPSQSHPARLPLNATHQEVTSSS
ncbi:MAG: hypothetical protein ACOZFS_04005 [Thermodesulfobacteriota bacterium]